MPNFPGVPSGGLITPAAPTPTAIAVYISSTELGETNVLIDSSDNITGVGGIVMDGDLDLTATATNQIICAPGTALAPGLAFGDGDTGFFEALDDNLRTIIAGVEQIAVTTTNMTGVSTNNFAILHSSGLSSTTPDYSWIGDGDTGLGHAGLDMLGLIAGGVEGLRISEANGELLHTFSGTEVESITDASTTGSAATLTKAGENFDVTCTAGDIVFVHGSTTAADLGTYVIKTVTSATVLTLNRNFSTSNTDVDFFVMSKSIAIKNSSGADATLILPSALYMREITTPTAIDSYGAFFTKADNKPYFQSGDGVTAELETVATNLAEMTIHDNSTALVINSVNKEHAVRLFLAGDLSTAWTFNAGSTGAITDTADNAGTLRITDVAHGLVTGDIITVTGLTTASQNDVTAVTKIDDDTLDCDDITFATASETGTWDQGSYFLAGVGAGGKYLIDFATSVNSAGANKTFEWHLYADTTRQENIGIRRKFSNTDIGVVSGSAIITVTDGQVIWVSVQDQTDATNLTFVHANLNMHKI